VSCNRCTANSLVCCNRCTANSSHQTRRGHVSCVCLESACALQRMLLLLLLLLQQDSGQCSVSCCMLHQWRVSCSVVEQL